MAAPDLSAVVALCNKSFDLHLSGHMARSNEYDQRALAAAQALGAEDCLIVATLQLRHATVLFQAALYELVKSLTGVAPPPETATLLSLFFDVVSVVQRRKAAGTLLAGSCRDAEVMWTRLINEHQADTLGDSQVRAAAAVLASLVGHTLLISVATQGCNIFNTADGLPSITRNQLRICLALMADAAELMMQPRLCEGCLSLIEGGFVKSMRMLAKHPEAVLPHGAVGVRVMECWRRLQQCGVLERRYVDEAIQATKLQKNATSSAVAAAAAAPGLRSCGLASCGAREQHQQHFKSCAACRSAAYCCKEHQTEHWPSHKAACKAARKAAEQQAD